MWGDSKVNLVTRTACNALISGLKVDIYNGRVSLNSCVSTTVEIIQDIEPVEGCIQAACFDEEEMSIMIGESVYVVTSQQMERIFPLFQFTEKKTIKAKHQGSSITEIVAVSGEEEKE
ncbi:uncharacterized protein LOC134234264 [Saccostrea cucullata]|uniref:uncharacterized protein LOC134234264 n=1 Tax=Saccostrea cuccullata TaxID=36930 RepID=UPI002ED54C1C